MEINRECDMIRIAFDNVFNLPAACKFGIFIVQIQGDAGTVGAFGNVINERERRIIGLLQFIFALAVGNPLPYGVFTCFFRNYFDFRCNHKGWIKPNAELTDQVGIFFIFRGKLLQKRLGAGAGNRTEVVFDILIVHTDTRVADSQRRRCGIFVKTNINTGIKPEIF